MRRTGMATRDALAAAVSERHGRTGQAERSLILDESAAVTGLVARRQQPGRDPESLFRTRLANEIA